MHESDVRSVSCVLNTERLKTKSFLPPDGRFCTEILDPIQKRIEGKKQRRERNHRLFLAAGLLIEAGLVDTKTGELCYKKDRILQALKELKYDLETSPNPDA